MQALVLLLTLQGITHHVQGIDTDGVHLWVTAVDRPTHKGFLYEFAVKDGTLLRQIETQDGDRYHPGGLQADAESLWLPVAEYKAGSSAKIQQRSKRTLAVIFEFSVPDHIGCIAVTPDLIIGGNWDSRDFYVWNHQGKLLRKVANQTGNSYQDLKFHDGQLLASGLLPGRKSAIDWLNLQDFQLQKRVPLGNTDRGDPLSREGMTIFNGKLWLLPEDTPSRLFEVTLPK